jgi:phosphotransferase system, enzyme I, PtsP
MLLELDCKKAEQAIVPLLQQPVGTTSLRQKLEQFAAAEGLQL